MHIKITSVGRYQRNIEAFKPNSMKLKQKPSKFVWQHSEDGIVSQTASVPLLDFAVIEGIITTVLASASHQCVHYLTSYDSYLQNAMKINSTMNIMIIYKLETDIVCINIFQLKWMHLGLLPYIQFNPHTRA